MYAFTTFVIFRLWLKDDIGIVLFVLRVYFCALLQVVQRKVDIPIVDKDTCQTKIKAALNAKKPGVGDKVTISPSEVRAQFFLDEKHWTLKYKEWRRKEVVLCMSVSYFTVGYSYF